MGLTMGLRSSLFKFVYIRHMQEYIAICPCAATSLLSLHNKLPIRSFFLFSSFPFLSHHSVAWHYQAAAWMSTGNEPTFNVSTNIPDIQLQPEFLPLQLSPHNKFIETNIELSSSHSSHPFVDRISDFCSGSNCSLDELLAQHQFQSLVTYDLQQSLLLSDVRSGESIQQHHSEFLTSFQVHQSRHFVSTANCTLIAIQLTVVIRVGQRPYMLMHSSLTLRRCVLNSYVSLFPGSLQGPQEKRLLHHLLDKYNTLERPVAKESDPLQLSFGLTLMQIIDVVSSLMPTYIIVSFHFPSFHCFHH